MTNLTDEQRRALSILARHLYGCDEAVLTLAGFSTAQLAELVIDDFAERRTRILSDGRKVVWLQITAGGRKESLISEGGVAGAT
jgi:hypothetical protein